MNPHEILDERESLRGPLFGSLALHGGAFAVFIGLTVFHPFTSQVEHWGDPNGGRFGAVTVNAVPSIQLPSKSSIPNPVANDTESQVPERPSKKEQKAVVDNRAAIALKSKKAPKERPVQRAQAAPNKWADQQQYRQNQVYSNVGQAAGSPLYQMQGGGGVGVGTNSPFGTRFGYYANIIRGKVEGAWKTTDINPRIQNAPPVTVQFVIRKDGSIAPGLPRIVQTSGDGNVDRSAQRAIMDAAPFPPLPNGFERSEALVELTFQLRR